ncbi:hypothetical protein Ahy_B05g077406 [Arachis hypogaea]|uniref:Myb/SANT-like domain-containing protein n=1 Tax=Arachis hypogaea TaxID=3818 RepID=A0A444Z4W0_ARAHY|nr:hypothetical protein Ahy_B05g077406 [Arachis hypogaea]
MVMMDRSEQIKLCVGYYWIMRIQFDTLMLLFLVTLYMYIRNRRWGHSTIGRRVNILPLRRDALDNIIGEGRDRNCIWELRMNLNAFATLCELLQVQGETIDVVKSSQEWTQWREDLATEMWKIWRGERGDKWPPYPANGLNKKLNSKRTDAGQFKPGAFQKLADKMNEKFPGCGLTVKYIRNKHKRLKEKYMFVAEMLGCSGFGWNSEKMRVEVDSKQVLEAWGKVVAMLHYTPGKPFPLFEPLRSIFGKDRATGLDAYSGKDAEEDVILGSTFAVATSSGLGLGGDNLPRANYPIPFQPHLLHQMIKIKDVTLQLKKTNDAAILSNLAETFKSAVEDQGKHVQVLANAMSGVDEQVNLGRTLKSLGFTTIEIVQIAKKIVQNPELKATFWSLDEEKEAFARDIMDNF